MSLTDALLGCTTGIPLAFWVVSLVGWMIVGDIDPGTGLLGILAAVGISVMCFVPPIPGMAPYLILASFCSLVIWPIARSTMARREIASVDVMGIEQGYSLLGQRPANPVARLKIAQHLYNLGHHGHAIAIADSVMKQLPERVFLDEHRMVRVWKRNPPMASAYRPISCVECGHLNPPGTVHCQRCGEPFLLHMVQGKIMPSRLGRKLVAIWLAMALLLGGIPLASSLHYQAAVPVCVALVLLAGTVVFAGFHLSGGSHHPVT